MFLAHDSYYSRMKHHHDKDKLQSQTSRVFDEWHQSSSEEEPSFLNHEDSCTLLSYEGIVSTVVVPRNDDAYHHSSISSFLSRFSIISDLSDIAKEDAVRRLRGEIELLQSTVLSDSEMPVTDLIKCLEKLLKVEEDLQQEEDCLKKSQSTRRESMGFSDSDSVLSFEEEDIEDTIEQSSRSIHPMETIVTPQERQDCSPTPRIGNRKRLQPQVAASLPHYSQDDSPKYRRGGRKPGTITAYVDAAGQITKYRGRNTISAASDHGPRKPERTSSNLMATRWSRSCGSMTNLKKKKADSSSASDALGLNVKLDRANYRKRRFIKTRNLSTS